MTTAVAAARPQRMRLDMWLATHQGLTRSAARTLIDAGRVSVNGRAGKPGLLVQSDDAVLVGLDATPQPRVIVEACDAPELSVVYEDDHLAVIDKPAGLVVHPAPGHATGTLADALRARGSTWSTLGGAERPGIVHRLDRDTSGLLVVAKSEMAHRSLAQQLQQRTLGRTYIALVMGGFREASGTIDAPIGRDQRDRKRMAVADRGRAAVTDFLVRRRVRDVSELEVSLRTGRTHQIRVHLAYIRHPVVGDVVYGKPEPMLGRLALHATRLRFVHPADGSSREFVSPAPVSFAEFLAAVAAGG